MVSSIQSRLHFIPAGSLGHRNALQFYNTIKLECCGCRVSGFSRMYRDNRGCEMLKNLYPDGTSIHPR